MSGNLILGLIGAVLFILGTLFLINFETNEGPRFTNFMLKIQKFSGLPNGVFLIGLVVFGFALMTIGAVCVGHAVKDWLRPLLLG